MPRVHLTDIVIRAFRSADAQITYWDDILPAFGVRVGKRAKTFVVMLGKRRKRVSLGSYPAVSLQEARHRARQLLAGLNLAPIRGTAPTAADAVGTFFETHRPQNKARTRNETRRLLERHFLPKHGHRPIDEISTTQIIAITDALLHTPTEAIHAHAAIKTFFGWALRRRLIERSPLAGLPLPAKPGQRDRVLTDHELRAVWHAATDYPFGTIVRLLILTGQRRSEIGALQWCYIAADTITLPAWLCKNNTEHTFPHGSMVRELIAAIPRLVEKQAAAR
jgi:integrase